MIRRTTPTPIAAVCVGDTIVETYADAMFFDQVIEVVIDEEIRQFRVLRTVTYFNNHDRVGGYLPLNPEDFTVQQAVVLLSSWAITAKADVILFNEEAYAKIGANR